MKNYRYYLNNIQSIFIGSLALCFVFLQLTSNDYIKTLVSIIILIIILWTLPKISGITLYISTFLLASAIFLMFYHTAPIEVWLNSLRVNLSLASIFIVVPLLGIPVKTGGYVNALRTIFSDKLNNSLFFLTSINCLTHFLSIIVNFGSVSIINELIKASDIKNVKLITTAINRGFISSLFWSPYSASMALILTNLSINWIDIFLNALGMVFITLILSVVLESKEIIQNNKHNKHNKRKTYNSHQVIKAKKKLFQLFIYIFLVIALILFIDKMTNVSIVFVIILVSLIFPYIWSIRNKQIKSYKTEFISHIFFSIPRMKKELILFLIAGFFSGAFVYADLGEFFMLLLQSIFGSFYIGKSYFISFIIFIFASIGVHPIVLVTILVTSINPEFIGLSTEYFTMLLLFSFGAANLVSPSTAVNNLLSNLFNTNLLNISFKWNFRFSIILLLIIPFYLMIFIKLV